MAQAAQSRPACTEPLRQHDVEEVLEVGFGHRPAEPDHKGEDEAPEHEAQDGHGIAVDDELIHRRLLKPRERLVKLDDDLSRLGLWARARRIPVGAYPDRHKGRVGDHNSRHT